MREMISNHLPQETGECGFLRIAFTLLRIFLYCFFIFTTSQLLAASQIPTENNGAQAFHANSIKLSISDNLITLDAKKADLGKIISVLSEASGIPITPIDLDKQSSIKVTVSIKNQPLAEALRQIMRQLPAGGFVLVSADDKSESKGQLKHAYILVKEGSSALPQPNDNVATSSPDKSRFNIISKQASGNKATQIEYVANQLLLKFPATTEEGDIKKIVKSINGKILNRADDLLTKIGYYHIQFPEGSDIEAIAESLLKQQAVKNAEPNYIARALFATPNDPLFPYQWGAYCHRISQGMGDSAR